MADKASILNRVETVSIDTDTVQIFLNATVYNSSYKHQLTIHIRGVPIASVDNISWSTGTAQRTVNLSAETKEAIQKYMFWFAFPNKKQYLCRTLTKGYI